MQKYLTQAFFILLCFGITMPARADITTGLVGWWKFDDGSGNTAVDSSGSGNNGDLTGHAPTWVSGCVQGGCLSFNGTSQYVNTSYNPPNVLTVSVWFKTTAYANTDGLRGIFSAFSGAGLALSVGGVNWSGCTTADRLELWADSNVCYSLSTTLSDNVWYHLAAVSNGSNILVYLNGGLINTFNNTTTASPYTVLIGKSLFNQIWFPGYIDDVRVYNRALTAADVRQLYGLSMSINFGGGTVTMGGGTVTW